MIGIYKITNPIGQVYIGQSKNLQRRKNEHFSNKGKKPFRLNESMLKHGKENHKFEIIEECIIDLLKDRERYWQDFYNVLELGLNCILEGTSTKPTVVCLETRIKQKNGNLGRIQSNEERQKRLSIGEKIVLDTNTGVFYNNAQEVVDLYKYNKSTFVSWLNTTKKNKTPFRYALVDGIQNKY
jgi:group I intron endonuclease